MARPGRALAYRTLLNVLTHLETKGLLEHTKHGRAYRYVATKSYEPWVPALVLVGLAMISLVSMTALVVRQLLSTRRLRVRFGERILAPEEVARAAVEAGIRRLVVTQNPAAFCVCEGLLSPRVVISSALISRLSARQLLAVLAHEASHARHRDPLALLGARAAGAGLCLVPLARRLLRVCEIRAELAADACRSGSC